MKTWRPLRYRVFRLISQHKEIPCLFLTPSRNYRALDKRQITKFVKCINTKFQTSVEFQKSCMMSNCLILQDLIVHLLISWEISHVQIYHITSYNQVVTVE